jgi:hypothetical protein
MHVIVHDPEVVAGLPVLPPTTATIPRSSLKDSGKGKDLNTLPQSIPHLPRQTRFPSPRLTPKPKPTQKRRSETKPSEEKTSTKNTIPNPLTT